MNDADYALVLSLQEQLYDEFGGSNAGFRATEDYPNSSTSQSRSIVDSEWELLDPNPDILALFQEFDKTYFWNKLTMVEVKWSKRMTLCAGLCRYEGYGGLCSISLSQPLLKLRPRKDLVETLLHEMIHAYLFVTQNNRDHDAHGPEFCKHMRRLNQATGSNITIYHSFHDEVNEMRKHWWRCQGPCKLQPPYFGYVKRAMNRAPSSNDNWWADHERKCGGKYVKIKEPENYRKKEPKTATEKHKNSPDISKFLTQPSKPPAKPSFRDNWQLAKNDKAGSSGYKLGGSKTATENGRGIPTTSRLLAGVSGHFTQPIKSVNKHDSTAGDVINKSENSHKSAVTTASAHAQNKSTANASKAENVHGRWNHLFTVKRRENRPQSNFREFLRKAKKRKRKSVSSGASAFESIQPILCFSKRVIRFVDADDGDPNKENTVPEPLRHTVVKRKESPVRSEETVTNTVPEPRGNTIVKREENPVRSEETATKTVKNEPNIVDEDEDLFWQGITIDLDDMSDNDDVLEDEFGRAVDMLAEYVTKNSQSDPSEGEKIKSEHRVEPSTSFSAKSGGVNGKVEAPSDCHKRTLKRLPSFSDDMDSFASARGNASDAKIVKTEFATGCNSEEFDFPVVSKITKLNTSFGSGNFSSGLTCKEEKPGNPFDVQRRAKRLPSFSDDEDVTLTQVWERRNRAKVIKLESDSKPRDSALPAFSRNVIPSPARDGIVKVKKERPPTMSPRLSSITANTSSALNGSGDKFEPSNSRDLDNTIPSKHSRVSCPICGVFCSAETINEHVDDCLSNGTASGPRPKDVKSEPGSATSHPPRKNSGIASDSMSGENASCSRNIAEETYDYLDESVPRLSLPSENASDTSHASCPICGILCPAETINMHIDDCLSLKAISEANWD